MMWVSRGAMPSGATMMRATPIAAHAKRSARAGASTSMHASPVYSNSRMNSSVVIYKLLYGRGKNLERRFHGNATKVKDRFAFAALNAQCCHIGNIDVASEMLRLAMPPAVTFELHGHMPNLELNLQHLMHVGEHTILIGVGSDHRMRGECELARGQAPYVEIVHFGGALNREEILAQLIEVDVRGHRLHQDVDAFADETPGAVEHQRADEKAHDRVGGRPSGEINYRAGNEHAAHANQIGNRMDEDRAHRHAGTATLAARVVRHPGGENIYHEADDGDAHHRQRGNRF